MCYYDHASAIALKLDRWGHEKDQKGYELEAELANAHLKENSMSFWAKLYQHFYGARQ